MGYQINNVKVTMGRYGIRELPSRRARTDARGQGRVHVDDGGGLRAGDAEPGELVAEEQAELLEDW